MSDYLIKLLRNLIAIDSVNPSLVPGGAGEEEVAQALASEMRSIGLDVEVTEVGPGRPNVVGILEGRFPGRALMLCGHLDTVGVIGMKDPFNPVERDGRIYGRGSQDMKGGVAAMIGAAKSVTESGGLESGRLILAAVVDEEYASIGAEALVSGWNADAAVVLEPTDLAIATAHKGFSWVEISTEGQAAHGSRPKDGRDAILRMGRVLSRMEALDKELQSRLPHPLLGTASLHASLIHGGRELSTYPDRCSLQMERRTLSGEPPEVALTEIQGILTEIQQEDPEFTGHATLKFAQPPYEIPQGNDLPDLLQEVTRRMGRVSQRAGMTFWTDAAILGKAGIPSVIFGPGGAGLHGLEEYVRTDEVIFCCHALADLARNFCAQK